MKVITSAPGKLIVSGEHAILHGYSAIALALQERVEVKITTLDSDKDADKIIIISDTFGYIECSKSSVVAYQQHNWYDPILFLVKSFKISGLKIEISSHIDDFGFGASGAIFACVVSGLLQFGFEPIKEKNIIVKQAIKYYYEYCKLKNTHNFASGIDVITSILGGVVYFEPKKQTIISLPVDIFNKFNGMTAVYTGHKTATIDACKVANSVSNCEEIYEKIGFLTQRLYMAIIDKDISNFQSVITRNHQCLQRLGLCDEDIVSIVNICEKRGSLAKLSGSGLGDCVLVFDKIKTDKYKTADIKIDNRGVFIKVSK